MILMPLAFAALAAQPVPILLADSSANGCLSQDEVHGAVNAGEAIAPAMASRHAREAAPGDLVRMRLCREDGILRYLITVLKRDGRVARVTVEANSGKVSQIR
jgi:uncharacterized membrane protein YkoI